MPFHPVVSRPLWYKFFVVSAFIAAVFDRRTAVLCGFCASYETQRTAMDIGIM